MPKKPTISINPKTVAASRKVRITTIPFPVLAEVGLAMQEGAKHGLYNYRVAPVIASVYIDATVLRHLGAWWEGEDIDRDSSLSHVTKAIASLVVLRDAMMNGTMVDDRPVRPKMDNWVQNMNKLQAEIIERIEDKILPPFTQKRVEAMKKEKGKSPAVVPVITQLIPKKKKPTVMSVKKKKQPKAKNVKSKKRRAG